MDHVLKGIVKCKEDSNNYCQAIRDVKARKPKNHLRSMTLTSI